MNTGVSTGTGIFKKRRLLMVLTMYFTPFINFNKDISTPLINTGTATAGYKKNTC
jgi:hypothetical protein